mmetsp:Transcript_8082/g.17509  ORF Transcript_8082/g.17509 Transcript_8082/m.17509 type:complete len:534 (-) Transcript_8082:158-1759(-)|eukprot:CAMPEP_0204259690 /NCGR_PEP_ID=MMETSP0468-20130131/5815_1 /ASSEMBLY_ACC=CAM_ASM_000383 /TAXON_ID=2969 /ORGANISM="Oxyrrhis marina" /LENGTH=533 /DNA_ID=CAMNT_0051234011 /DNA_START=83 /DNA_END=1684 /DNA_ORIENTATION=+
MAAAHPAENGDRPFKQATPVGGLKVATWNIAAVNNNPFEYWVTHDSAEYDKLMSDVETFLENPGANDIPIEHIFTDAHWSELASLLRAEFDGVDEVEKCWNDDLKHKKIVSGFLKDKMIGKKRLASMPDRITNTIHTMSDSKPACRPTVINNFQGDLTSVDKWWVQWKEFMFQRVLRVRTKKGAEDKRPCEMLEKICASKYPDVTPQEEAISLPLQTLCQAIFDCVWVHILNTVSPTGSWLTLKRQICEHLVESKTQRIIQILENCYSHFDVVFLQEVAATFLDAVAANVVLAHPQNGFTCVFPERLDGKRDQNSMLLLSRRVFNPTTVEVTEHMLKSLRGQGKGGTPINDGDLLCITCTDLQGSSYLLASFHGDTNGLATLPVVHTLAEYWTSLEGVNRLVVGLDANVYTGAANGYLDVSDFVAAYRSAGLTSCCGDDHQALSTNAKTTFNARTYLQPQLNKAVRSSEKESKGDNNPKDFILFHEKQMRVLQYCKDNTGSYEYLEGIPFPTLHFPSDHGVLAAQLAPLETPA